MWTKQSLWLIAAAALTANACGSQTSPSSSPIAPSATTAPSVPTPTPIATGTATIFGTIAANGFTSAFRGITAIRPTGSGPAVSVVGSSATAPVDSGGRFTLTGVPTGDVQLQFSGAGMNALLTVLGVNDHETIQIAVTVSGASASADTTERVTPDNHVQLEGRVSSISSSGHSFALLDSIVLVGVDTRISGGSQTLQFSDIQVNDRVHVSGTKTTATTVAASEVLFQTTKPALPPAQINGQVSALAGTCPTVTFSAGGTKISTDAATQFTPGSCGQLVNGVTAHVEGSLHADGSVTASRVEIQPTTAGTQPKEMAGAIAALTGTCPTIAFTLGTTKVTTNATTSFANVLCSSLATGTTVNVQGTSQPDGSLLAARVEKTGR